MLSLLPTPCEYKQSIVPSEPRKHYSNATMNIIHNQFSIEASDGEVLYCDTRLPADTSSLPILVIAHGFKGFKDWGFFPHVGNSFANQGWYVLQFNFSHNGIEGHSEDFTRLDKFAENTFSREVQELQEVIDALIDGNVSYAEHIDTSTIATLGHSRGGGIVLLEGVNDSRVKAISTWASVSTFDRYTEPQIERWRRDGYLEAKNARTGQMMRLNISLLNDVEQNSTHLDILNAATLLNRPLFIAHGEVDLSVTIENGKRLYQAADTLLTEFLRIPKTGHTFGAVHPFQETTPALESLIEGTNTFLKQRLGL